MNRGQAMMIEPEAPPFMKWDPGANKMRSDYEKAKRAWDHYSRYGPSPTLRWVDEEISRRRRGLEILSSLVGRHPEDLNPRNVCVAVRREDGTLEEIEELALSDVHIQPSRRTRPTEIHVEFHLMRRTTDHRHREALMDLAKRTFSVEPRSGGSIEIQDSR